MRTGLQTLEDEKKAIVDITNELSQDQIMNQLDLKDLDTIQSKCQLLARRAFGCQSNFDLFQDLKYFVH